MFYAKIYDKDSEAVLSHHIHLFLSKEMRQVWLDKYKSMGAEIVLYRKAMQTMKRHGGGYIHSIQDNIDSCSPWRYNI